MFQDRGVPARSTNTTVTITVLDNDDLDPKFTRDVYKAKIYEFYPMPVSILWIYCYWRGDINGFSFVQI